MRLRDYFRPESRVYRHLSPEKRNLRATELRVGVGFGVFSVLAVLLAFLLKVIYDNQYLFRAWLE